ncbi:MAG: hypothetical protein IE910_00150 [Brevundimonas sp.]|nr:hypothetical protein [Brevundimonas sp.]
MTSCLLLKGPDRILAVSDGRLAVSETQVSFDTVEKIRRFTPRYKIPRVSVGRYSHMDTMVEHDCFLAYAGTYALVSQITERFIRAVSGDLFLVRGDQWVPQLADDFRRSGYFDDSYNFDQVELPKMAPRILVDELLAAAESVGAEWSANGRRPDCEFLLFGPDPEDRRYFALKISPDGGWFQPGDRVSFRVSRVEDGVVASIGSSEVTAAVAADADLQKGALGWRTDQTEIDIHNVFAEMDLGEMRRTPAREPLPRAPAEENWRSDEVKDSFIRLMTSAEDKFVGGNFTIASASQRSREFTSRIVTVSG